MLARDEIAAFLTNRDRPMCVRCLATALRLPFRRAHDGCLDLTLGDSYKFQRRRCAECRELSEVIVRSVDRVGRGRPTSRAAAAAVNAARDALIDIVMFNDFLLVVESSPRDDGSWTGRWTVVRRGTPVAKGATDDWFTADEAADAAAGEAKRWIEHAA
jgi:hypothetical protein